MTINKDTRLFGSYSIKPGNKGAEFFNAAFQRYNLNAIYKGYYIEDIEKGVQAARTLDFGGFAVAMPHKRTIVPFLDEVDAEALAIGTVNTVVNIDKKFKGFNTDYLGLCKIFPILDKDEYVVIGNGGLAASVLYYLNKHGINYSMIVRSNWDDLLTIEGKNLINCTPVNLDHLSERNTVIDLNVGYEYGDLLHKYQAQEQFRLYTGISYGAEDLSGTNVQEHN